jgi:FG-GAP-like repeat
MRWIRAAQGALLTYVMGASAFLMMASAAQAAPTPDGLMLRHSGTGQLLLLSHRGINALSWDQRTHDPVGVPAATAQPVPGDFDDDGDTDLIVRDSATGTTVEAISDGSGGIWATHVVSGLRPSSGQRWRLYAGDLGGDGADDLLLRHEGDGTVLASINNGHGAQFQPSGTPQLTGVAAGSRWVPLPSDVDDDGDTDLLLRDRDSGDTQLARNTGEGRFAAPVWVQGLASVAGAAWTPFVADLGGTGADDLLLRHAGTGAVRAALNSGNGLQFSGVHGEQLSGFGASAAWEPIIGSFDADATQDLMIRNVNTGQTAVASNAGDGRLSWDGAYRAGSSGIGAGGGWQAFAATVRSAPGSHDYGGVNGSVDTPAEAEALARAATGIGASALVASLTISDQRYLRSSAAWRGTQRGSLPLIRRVDPSFDDALRRPSLQRSIQTRVARLAAHDSLPAVSLDVLTWHPAVDVYVNATGVHADNPARVQQAAPWLVRDSAGRPVLVDRWRMLDVRNPDARRWWRLGSDGIASCHPDRDQRGALDLAACGYDGLWLDNVLTALTHFSPAPPFAAAGWEEGVAAQVQELRDELDRRGGQNVRITANMKWNDTGFGSGATQTVDPSRGFARAARAADQVLLENEALTPYVPGVDSDGPASRAFSVRRLLSFVDQLHAFGATAQWEKTGSRGFDGLPASADCNEQGTSRRWIVGDAIWDLHVRTSVINLATALLVARQGDAVGDMCEYPDRPWLGYGADDLGSALGGRYEVGGLLARRYSAGIVFLNAGTQAHRADVPEAGRRLGTMTEVGPGAVTLPGRSALIVSYR